MGYLNTSLLCWSTQLNKSVKYLVWVSVTWPVNVTSRRPLTLRSGFLEIISTLHDELSKVRSQTSTRSRFKLLHSKTATYRNSILPALSRLLVDRNAELNHYLQNLSWIYIYIYIYILFPLTLLYYCPRFYHLKFVEEEAENFTFSVK